ISVEGGQRRAVVAAFLVRLLRNHAAEREQAVGIEPRRNLFVEVAIGPRPGHGEGYAVECQRRAIPGQGGLAEWLRKYDMSHLSDDGSIAGRGLRDWRPSSPTLRSPGDAELGRSRRVFRPAGAAAGRTRGPLRAHAGRFRAGRSSRVGPPGRWP